MYLLHVFRTSQPPLAFVFPSKGPITTNSQYVDGLIEHLLSLVFRVLSIARDLFHVLGHASIENALAVVRGIKSRIEIPQWRACTPE
jgi:hypothetical protein